MCSAGQVGTGATIASIERIRDTFIDTRFRNQTADNSSLDIQNKYLSEVQDITDQPSNTGIQKALSDFYAAFSALNVDPVNGKTVAVGKAATLATFIQDSYTQLETKNNNIQASLNTNVTEVNKYLDDINSLNAEIKKVSSIGLTPNDLMDKRDNLLDKLSEEFGATVTRRKDNTIDVTSNENTSSVGKLIDSADTTGATGTRFSYYDSATYNSGTGTLTVTYFKQGDSTKPATIPISGVATQADADALTKQLEQNRVLIADKNGTVTAGNVTQINDAMFKIQQGEIGGNQTVQDQIKISMNDLDTLAKSLAYTVNAIQTGSTDISTTMTGLNPDLIFVVDGTNTDTGINAKNIKINSTLQNNSTLLNCNTTATSGDHDGTRALAISNIQSLKINYTALGNMTAITSRSDFFTTSGVAFASTQNAQLNSSSTGATIFNNYNGALTKLSTNAEKISVALGNSEKQLADFKNQRLEVSGVSQDEEATNLVAYNHAYQANAKVISTIDKLLDVVINGLGA
jgi:flagellar hook-associated protein 1 FlgK